MEHYFTGRRFAPKWYFVVLTVIFLAAFISLGRWQLHRADEKKALQASFTSRMQLAPLMLAQTAGRDVRYYPVTMTGYYDNAHTILLDNKIYQHQIGYEVVTPLIPADDERTVLINRGWVPAGPSRKVLPDIPAITGKQRVTGIIYEMPGKPFILGGVTEQNIVWPLRLQALDIKAISSLLDRPLYPFVVLLMPDAQSGFVRDWQPVSMPAQKHIGYAVQWFTFAGVLVIIFLVLSFRKSK